MKPFQVSSTITSQHVVFGKTYWTEPKWIDTKSYPLLQLESLDSMHGCFEYLAFVGNMTCKAGNKHKLHVTKQLES